MAERQAAAAARAEERTQRKKDAETKPKRIKEEGEPKAARSAYVFFKDSLTSVEGAPSLRKIATEKWKALAEGERVPFIEQEERDNERYAREMEAFQHPERVAERRERAKAKEEERQRKEAEKKAAQLARAEAKAASERVKKEAAEAKQARLATEERNKRAFEDARPPGLTPQISHMFGEVEGICEAMGDCDKSGLLLMFIHVAKQLRQALSVRGSLFEDTAKMYRDAQEKLQSVALRGRQSYPFSSAFDDDWNAAKLGWPNLSLKNSGQVMPTRMLAECLMNYDELRFEESTQLKAPTAEQEKSSQEARVQAKSAAKSAPPAGMPGVSHKCEDCQSSGKPREEWKTAKFGFKQPNVFRTARWCGTCRENHEGSVDIVNQLCLDCGGKQGNFGFEDRSAVFCSICAKFHPGASNLQKKGAGSKRKRHAGSATKQSKQKKGKTSARGGSDLPAMRAIGESGSGSVDSVVATRGDLSQFTAEQPTVSEPAVVHAQPSQEQEEQEELHEEEEEEEEEEEGEVDEVLEHALNEEGQIMYKVRWVGTTPDEDTWEPFQESFQEKIDAHREWWVAGRKEWWSKVFRFTQDKCEVLADRMFKVR